MSTVELLTSFGSRIKQLRRALGLAVREVAAEMRVHVSALYNIERGVHGFSLHRLPKLARTLGVDELDLFTFPERSLRHALVDLSRQASLEALDAAHALLRDWPPEAPRHR